MSAQERQPLLSAAVLPAEAGGDDASDVEDPLHVFDARGVRAVQKVAAARAGGSTVPTDERVALCCRECCYGGHYKSLLLDEENGRITARTMRQSRTQEKGTNHIISVGWADSVKSVTVSRQKVSSQGLLVMLITAIVMGEASSGGLFFYNYGTSLGDDRIVVTYVILAILPSFVFFSLMCALVSYWRGSGLYVYGPQISWKFQETPEFFIPLEMDQAVQAQTVIMRMKERDIFYDDDEDDDEPGTPQKQRKKHPPIPNAAKNTPAPAMPPATGTKPARPEDMEVEDLSD